MKKKPIVVGVSGAQPAALRFAASQAVSRGVGMRVIHCVEPLSLWDQPSMSTFRSMASGRTILEFSRDLVKEQAADVEGAFVEATGSPVDILLREAAGASMLVLGTESEKWTERLFSAHVSEQVLTNAQAPVAVVPELEFPEPPTSVVVALDARGPAIGALQFAFSEAQTHQQDLQVVHVLPVGKTMHELGSLRTAIADTLAEWAVRFPDVAVKSRLVFNEVDAGCLRIGREAGLLVLGRRQISPATVLFGHPVLIQIAHEARCPCVVVPDDWEPDASRSLGQSAHKVATNSIGKETT